MAPPTRGTASAAFLSRFWNTCSSWSGSPAVGGSDGSNSSVKRTCAAKPACAARRARSSTSWMLSGLRCAGRRSPNCSTRSTSLPMRAASAWMSPVSSRSASPRPISRSCAAPEMPASGFRISCASIAAMPVTERAAERWPRLRSIFSAMPCGCIRIRISPSPSCSGAAWMFCSCGGWSAQPTMTSYCATETPLRRAWPHHVEHGAVVADEPAERPARPSAAARSRRSSRSPDWR